MSAKNIPAQSASRQYEKQSAVSTGPGRGEKGPLEDYLPLVKYIAGRLAIGLPRSVEMDDLINAGVVGLIESYHNFDSDKNVKFETYASFRIRGSILDELRGMDWVPRSTRARSRAPSPDLKVSWVDRPPRWNWRLVSASSYLSTTP